MTSSAYGSGKVHWMRSGVLAAGGGNMWCGYVLKLRNHPVNKYVTAKHGVTCQKCLQAEARAILRDVEGESNG